MVRTIGMGTLIVVLTGVGLTWGQHPAAPPASPGTTSGDRFMMVREPGKPGLKCKILRQWRTSEGCQAFEVEDVASREKLTVVEGGSGQDGAAQSARIYAWGGSTTPPEGAPTPPPAPVAPVRPPVANAPAAVRPPAPGAAAPNASTPSNRIVPVAQQTVVPPPASAGPVRAVAQQRIGPAPAGASHVGAVAPPRMAPTPFPAAASPGVSAPEFKIIREPGKSDQKCKVLKKWTLADGAQAYQVESTLTGELMTIVENGPHQMGRPSSGQAYSWGPGRTPPAGVPLPPGVVASKPVEPTGPILQTNAVSTSRPAVPPPASRPVAQALATESTGPNLEPPLPLALPTLPPPVAAPPAPSPAYPVQANPVPPERLAPVAPVGPIASAEPVEYKIVQEPGRPPQKCKVLKTFATSDGLVAYEVEAIESGEKMTIVEGKPKIDCLSSSREQTQTARIFPWGRNTVPPPETPLPAPSWDDVNPSPPPPSRPRITVTTETVTVPAASDTAFHWGPFKPSKPSGARADVADAKKEGDHRWGPFKALGSGHARTGPAVPSADPGPRLSPVQSRLDAASRTESASKPAAAGRTDEVQLGKQEPVQQEMAQPSDWRQSWGQTRSYQMRAPDGEATVSKPKPAPLTSAELAPGSAVPVPPTTIEESARETRAVAQKRTEPNVTNPAAAELSRPAAVPTVQAKPEPVAPARPQGSGQPATASSSAVSTPTPPPARKWMPGEGKQPVVASVPSKALPGPNSEAAGEIKLARSAAAKPVSVAQASPAVSPVVPAEKAEPGSFLPEQGNTATSPAAPAPAAQTSDATPAPKLITQPSTMAAAKSNEPAADRVETASPARPPVADAARTASVPPPPDPSVWGRMGAASSQPTAPAKTEVPAEPRRPLLGLFQRSAEKPASHASTTASSAGSGPRRNLPSITVQDVVVPGKQPQAAARAEAPAADSSERPTKALTVAPARPSNAMQQVANAIAQAPRPEPKVPAKVESREAVAKANPPKSEPAKKETPKAPPAEKPDPLTQPEVYSRRSQDFAPAISTPSKPREAPGAVQQVADKDIKQVSAAVPAQSPAQAPAVAPAPVAGGPSPPLGVRSVVAAQGNRRGGPSFVPVPMVTLPSLTAPRPNLAAAPRPPQPTPIPVRQGSDGSLENAFTVAPDPVQQAVQETNQFSQNAFVVEPPANRTLANGFTQNSGPSQMISAFQYPYPMTAPPANPMAYQQMMARQAAMMAGPPPYPMYGPPAGMAYPGPGPAMGPAYNPYAAAPGYYPPAPGHGPVPVGYPGAMPACPPQPQLPAAPSDSASIQAAHSAQAMQQVAYVANAGSGPQAAAAAQQTTPQLLLTLRDALYPSQREWAAEALAVGAAKADPQVVQALITAAATDSAATVRAGSIRCLARLKVDNPQYRDALQRLQGDGDPRVRKEVEQALTVLGTVPAR